MPAMSLCSPFIADNVGRVTVYDTAASLPTTSDERYEGKMAWIADTNRLVQWDGTGWVVLREPPQTYTPTLSNATLGSGTVTGTSHRSDGYCDVHAVFTLGAGSAVSGSVGFTLPHAAFSTASFGAGQALLNDSGTGTWVGQVLASTTGIATVAAILASGTYAQQWGMSSTIPFTWVSGDSIAFTHRYRLNSAYL